MSEVLNLGKAVQSQGWFCRQTLMPLILCEQLYNAFFAFRRRSVSHFADGPLGLVSQTPAH